jgi:16S rRNA (guanine(966)-N(2))-methyltransferase RsmD
MPIRVIAGSAKGRRLKLVPGDSTRPVMDRVKEALFSILGRSIIGSNFLDLFAGTGSVGIEALSRGAKQALFVEVDRLALKTIHENLAVTQLSEKAEVRRIDAYELLRNAPSRHFDFIYVAPPQFHNLWLRTLESLEANPRWIPTGTVVIVQIAPTEQKALALEHLRPYDERRYGNTLLWFFEAVGEAE